MAVRKEVLVQLDGELVSRLDRLAKRRGVSRSELLREGAWAVLDAAEMAEADARLREAYRRQPQEMALVAWSTRAATETWPEW